ncbi:flagellar protein FlaG [Porticoccus sp.]
MTLLQSSNNLAGTSELNLGQLSGSQRVERVLEQLPPAATAEQPASMETLVKAVQQVNDVVRPYGVEFDIQQKSAKIVTRIIDRETGTVIRQFPSEEVLRIAERLDELAGLLLDQKV